MEDAHAPTAIVIVSRKVLSAWHDEMGCSLSAGLKARGASAAMSVQTQGMTGFHLSMPPRPDRAMQWVRLRWCVAPLHAASIGLA